jgi:hypothetical protein
LALGEVGPHELTTIGHLCREAVQAFAGTVATDTASAVSGTTAENTVARVRGALEALSIGGTERAFLKALLAYWGTVNDLVQRQEHGGKKEGEALGREDARRIVFHTMIVMYELDQVLTR